MKFINELIKLQKRIWIKTTLIFLILGLPLIPILFSLKSLSESILTFISYIFIIILCGCWISKSLCSEDIEKYKKIYSKNITLTILKTKLKDVKYVSEDKLLPKTFAEIIDNAKIPTINSYNNDDYIIGQYKNIQFEYSDLRMGYMPRNSDSNYSESFKGKWFIFTYDKNFDVNIQIGPKIVNGKKNKQMLKGNNYTEVKLSDEEFNKKILIYADNKEEVFKILTPNTINKVKKLYKDTKGKIFIFYIKNKLHIGLGDKKNLFEPNIYRKFNLEKEEKKILNQFNSIIDFIDYWV